YTSRSRAGSWNRIAACPFQQLEHVLFTCDLLLLPVVTRRLDRRVQSLWIRRLNRRMTKRENRFQLVRTGSKEARVLRQHFLSLRERGGVRVTCPRRSEACRLPRSRFWPGPGLPRSRWSLAVTFCIFRFTEHLWRYKWRICFRWSDGGAEDVEIVD